MFKLFILYTLVIAPNYQLNGAHVIGDFKNKADCETYARTLAEGLTSLKWYKNGVYECELQKEKK